MASTDRCWRLVRGFVLGATGAALTATGCGSPQPFAQPTPAYIAHAGGIGRNRALTNSLDALENSVSRGFNAIEIDLSWTSDNRMVLIHDWEATARRIFDREPQVMTSAEFRSAPVPSGLTLLRLEDLGPWLAANPNILVITDIKERNVEGLRIFAETFPEQLARIVPQIYHPDEFGPVRNLGFDKVVFTLYATDLDDESVVAFARDGGLFGVTMPIKRAFAGDLASRLAGEGVPVFVHPVNDYRTFVGLQHRGVVGIYTDWLSPFDADRDDRLPPWNVEMRGSKSIASRVVAFLPARMPGLSISIEINNLGESPQPVLLELLDPSGATLTTRTVELEPGEETELPTADLFPPSVDHGWIRVKASNDVDATSTWRYNNNPERKTTMESSACSGLVASGPGTGVSGLLLALVNPGPTAHTYTLQRQIDDDIIDRDTVELEAGGQLVRVYRCATDAQIELTVDGGPMIPMLLRWDPFVRYIE